MEALQEKLAQEKLEQANVLLLLPQRRKLLRRNPGSQEECLVKVLQFKHLLR
jgi:hypothetical protein